MLRARRGLTHLVASQCAPWHPFGTANESDAYCSVEPNGSWMPGGRDARRATPAPAGRAQPARHAGRGGRRAVVQPLVGVAAAQPARARGRGATARAGGPARAAHPAGARARRARQGGARPARGGGGRRRPFAHVGRRHRAHRGVPVGRARGDAAGAHAARVRASRPARRGHRTRARGRPVRGGTSTSSWRSSIRDTRGRGIPSSIACRSPRMRSGSPCRRIRGSRSARRSRTRLETRPPTSRRRLTAHG